jgi:hypothetical protein
MSIRLRSTVLEAAPRVSMAWHGTEVSQRDRRVVGAVPHGRRDSQGGTKRSGSGADVSDCGVLLRYLYQSTKIPPHYYD